MTLKRICPLIEEHFRYERMKLGIVEDKSPKKADDNTMKELVKHAMRDQKKPIRKK